MTRARPSKNSRTKFFKKQKAEEKRRRLNLLPPPRPRSQPPTTNTVRALDISSRLYVTNQELRRENTFYRLQKSVQQQEQQRQLQQQQQQYQQQLQQQQQQHQQQQRSRRQDILNLGNTVSDLRLELYHLENTVEQKERIIDTMSESHKKYKDKKMRQSADSIRVTDKLQMSLFAAQEEIAKLKDETQIQDNEIQDLNRKVQRLQERLDYYEPRY
jgi:DNA repair exonuclease SbcCD ATPase subunit